jgi:hypothetical protein
MAEVQSEGGAEAEAKQTEALGVLSELLAVYREIPVMDETFIARKLDGNFCGVNVESRRGARERFLESAGVREAQGRSRAGALRGPF